MVAGSPTCPILRATTRSGFGHTKAQGAPSGSRPTEGDEPVWSRDDRELYYRQGNAIMALAVRGTDAFQFDAPKLLFEGGFHHENVPSYDVTPDGTFIMMLQSDEARETYARRPDRSRLGRRAETVGTPPELDEPHGDSHAHPEPATIPS